MAGIVIPGFVAVPVVLLLSLWLYRDARERKMDTADVWAVGFFIACFIPPIIGGVIVFAFYLRERKGRGGAPTAVPPR